MPTLQRHSTRNLMVVRSYHKIFYSKHINFQLNRARNTKCQYLIGNEILR
jgi:hypothetical protein